VPLIVVGFISWLNVAVTRAVLAHTRVAPFGGVTAVTVGGGHGAEVVNVHTLLATSPSPKVSFAPVVTVAVKVVLSARGTVGVKVAILVAAS
jgi:hypothetical protein